MASLWKRPNSKFWYACYTFDGILRVKESLKIAAKSVAKRVANALETAARSRLDENAVRKLHESLQLDHQLSEHHARELAHGLYQRVTGRALVSSSVGDYIEAWITRRSPEISPATDQRYREVIGHFLKFIGEGRRRDIGTLTRQDISEFRDSQIAQYAVGTVKINLKILRMIFKCAREDGLLTLDIARGVKVFSRESDKRARRAFAAAELRRVLALASPEWRAIILTALYGGGIRLGDVVRLTWQNVDIENRRLRFVTRKSGRSQEIPITAPLLACLSALPAAEDVRAPLFPIAAKRIQGSRDGRVGALSNQFRALLARAGLVAERDHCSRGVGRRAQRAASELSFHCLRHTAQTWLDLAGVPKSVSMDIIGHDSAASSQTYTHVGESAKLAALAAFPDLSAA